MTQHVTPPGDDEDDEIEAIPLEDADLDADEIVEELEGAEE